MSEYLKQAKRLQTILNEEVGQRFHPVTRMDEILDHAKKLCSAAGASYVIVREVEFTAVLRGEQIDAIAEIVFAAFGELHSDWVAFCFYQDGFARAVIPFTDDTSDTKWLETFVKKELAG